jgi:large subunit ribosomal protein L25
MDVLKGEIRKSKLKSKQLRRKGIIPGVLYGTKENLESTNLQFSQKDVMRFLSRNIIGSRVNLEIDGEEQMALLKDVSYASVTNEVEHLTFMPLVKGEKINTIAHVILLNKEKISGTVQQTLFEISYRAFPTDLFDKIEIDLDGKQIGDSVKVEDLEVYKNENIEILIPEDTQVFAIVDVQAVAADEEEGEEDATEDSANEEEK